MQGRSTRLVLVRSSCGVAPKLVIHIERPSAGQRRAMQRVQGAGGLGQATPSEDPLQFLRGRARVLGFQRGPQQVAGLQGVRVRPSRACLVSGLRGVARP